ncbi:MAG: NADP(H)-dependent aldo-keto reductase [Rhodospirillales bacterium]|jgi:aryl-alcohol dehydrogenase-like predicted oxidoreductase|nr:NADP(H)-dependent aldo-keto reductase [Rhodospirillales bacterium]
MHYSKLGRTGIDVSRICLGTMTYGQQNSQNEGFAQMDMALDRGINFFDTAEMYSVPSSPETQGSTERVIGNWFAERNNRDKVVLGTKITGPGESFKHVRGGDLSFGEKQITEAVNQSLQRLRTDYIDLYQIHWPDRSTNFFGRLGYTHDDSPQAGGTPLQETLTVLAKMVKAGKIRAVGCSNETPWGLMKMLELAESIGLPRMASIQNPYSLLNRTFEIGLAEVSIREDCGLTAYSPLAMGTLSGKYLGGAKPPDARLTLFPHYGRYVTERGIVATQKYVDLAKSNGLDPAQMALAYVNSRRFLTSNVIGATTLQQLESNIESDDIILDDSILESIETIHMADPNPAP